ncbi:hypothetical protein FYK55_28510 [Roseiconus nitratireducens]|uniref:Uncharacterized protein n=1 Tax=Roseiconus nitratireducens TaxID=2605748 RepID=A0A5M6CKJ2_9BACT|nr:hypothetical protein [Roseiconus nitratireducens]KAA5535654.1 hypothetical protein FYK55_28510 [Roseiconus nitratireducens]
MIADSASLDAARKNWSGVEALREKLNVSAFSAVGVVGGTFPFSLADAAHNVPLLHAFSVLNDVLAQLASEGHFSCKSHFLGALVAKSANQLPWRDVESVKSGIKDRNRVAHLGVMLSRCTCWKHIDTIKLELTQFGILQCSEPSNAPESPS